MEGERYRERKGWTDTGIEGKLMQNKNEARADLVQDAEFTQNFVTYHKFPNFSSLLSSFAKPQFYELTSTSIRGSRSTRLQNHALE